MLSLTSPRHISTLRKPDKSTDWAAGRRGLAALDELGTKSEHQMYGGSRPPRLLSFRLGPYRLPRLFAQRLISAGATGCKIRSRDYFARSNGAVLLRSPLARRGAVEERQ